MAPTNKPDPTASVPYKVAQIGLYSAGLLALVAVLAILLPMLFTGPAEPPRLAQMPPPRAAEPPPPEAPRIGQLERLRRALADDIASGALSIEPVNDWIAIRVGSLATFEPAQATVLPGFAPLGRRIAAVVEKERGTVRIVGHTDNQGLSASSGFRDNQELSMARARAVSTLLGAGLSDASRLVVEGRGSSQPIADNGSAEGRTRNRRVEILIARERDS